ncbi:MAG: extracellular solute-binding protein [Bacteroidales bacterium]|nr:extracellular solute-binding protein [Bacteroidales bacterium]
MRKLNSIFLPLFISSMIFLVSCKSDKEKEIIIFHAGSLSVPLKEIATQYMEMNPGIDIKLEGAGSIACARKITELGKPCDIMASADYMVIEKFLVPDYTDWNIWFATNEMVIAYHDRSANSDIINSDNWYEILSDEDVVYGRADPNADPCGYRTVLMFKLAADYYGKEGLDEVLTTKDQNMIRPKGVDLVALLETNSLDYIIEYKSVCVQHQLNYINLPAEINLSDPAFEELYNSVSMDITGDRPGETIKIQGGSMIYGLTILNDAPNREDATDFLYYFLGERGRAVIQKHGQTPLSLYLSGSGGKVPDTLLDLIDR